jgi:hypothetical protein
MTISYQANPEEMPKAFGIPLSDLSNCQPLSETDDNQQNLCVGYAQRSHKSHYLFC